MILRGKKVTNWAPGWGVHMWTPGWVPQRFGVGKSCPDRTMTCYVPWMNKSKDFSGSNVKGGKDFLNPQTKARTVPGYISGIYSQLRDYSPSTTFYKNMKNVLNILNPSQFWGPSFLSFGCEQNDVVFLWKATSASYPWMNMWWFWGFWGVSNIFLKENPKIAIGSDGF